MFDRISFSSNGGGNHEHHHEVHEHRAPTDESIRLWNEMVNKAYDSIIKTFSTTDNKFSVAGALVSDIRSFGRVLHYKFTLNGRDIIGKFETNPVLMTLDECREQMVEHIGKHLAAELLISLFKEDWEIWAGLMQQNYRKNS